MRQKKGIKLVRKDAGNSGPRDDHEGAAFQILQSKLLCQNQHCDRFKTTEVQLKQ